MSTQDGSVSVEIRNGSVVRRAVTAAAANIRRRSTQHRFSQQYSVSLFYAMAAEEDSEVEDELALAQKRLRDLKTKISKESKNNFLLERDVRVLDSRIALLIQNRMALDDSSENIMGSLEDTDYSDTSSNLDSRKLQLYGNLFFLLQTEPQHIATLCRLVSLSEIDMLLQTVMFTLYGNQYESREENLLLTMFQSVLAAQFEATVEFGSLLRANTPVSRMLTTYTRRGPGQSYLKFVLSKNINQLLERKRDLNLQINPLKVFDEVVAEMEEKGTCPPDFCKSVTPEIAASNSEVQAKIKPRLEQLIAIANEYLQVIIDSLDYVPYGIRWVCKQIRSLTKRKYPEASESSISSLIGGFFFLRFINPAIVTPNAYMLIESNPDQNVRTTLTLIAKMLQNLANKPSYAKETYMIPTNSFVTDNKQRINEFLNDLCEVSDFYDTLEMDQYMALSKRDLSINITPNEIYNTQALLKKHLDKLAPEPTHHLHILLDDLGPNVPEQIPRKNNRPIQLMLESRWEASSIIAQEQESLLNTDGENITQNDLLYMETKSTFVQIVRSLPHTIRNLDLIHIMEAAGSAKDTQIAIKGMKAQALLFELETAGVVNQQDGYRLLTKEIQLELSHLGDLKTRVINEMESLIHVYKAIIDHNRYLQSQLDTYKTYLNNVRAQSGHLTTEVPVQKRSGLWPSSASSDSSQTSNEYNTDPSCLKKPGDKLRKKSSGIFKFSHQQLEKDGVIVESDVPDQRKANIFLTLQCPMTGTFIISLHYKGRDKPILELDLKLDDLLEKKEHDSILDLEYIKLNTSKVVQLLNKNFKSKNAVRRNFF
ncbi:putative ras GTPase-activating protein sar1 [Choanephora cucurbitarum]|nr:putative ras GTPase-activating protein sar1 [Choanephora cucurbitarum]